MKTIGKIVAGILIASVLLIGGCVAIIGAGLLELSPKAGPRRYWIATAKPILQ